MKLFRKPKSKFYWYDFTVRGHRYRGSTQDLVDFLFTLYVNAGKGPRIRDGVDAPIAWSSKAFSYMAAPNRPEAAQS